MELLILAPNLFRYCNSSTNPSGALITNHANGGTGPTSTGKFSMTWALTAGKIYYLLMDGGYNAGLGTGDRCYFDMTLTNVNPLVGVVVLPIRLISFKGKNRDGSNILDWATSSEENNSYFTLERSKEGDNFESIARKDGAGNSNTTLNYQVEDNNPLTGVNYYRLRMTDTQGMNTYSDIISVYSSTGKMIDFQGIHPNPANGSIFADFYVNVNTTLTVEVRDISGKFVKSFNSSVDAGKNSLEADIKDIDNGLYFITIRDIKSGEAYTTRFVKN
ncbi:MAG: T9SS type A sorting domain-containing protein [Bacteroidetes bacterium]|nr:T9SS type A sorting domain-containing protein [Bacteroidota bacterium]